MPSVAMLVEMYTNRVSDLCGAVQSSTTLALFELDVGSTVMGSICGNQASWKMWNELSEIANSETRRNDAAARLSSPSKQWPNWH